MILGNGYTVDIPWITIDTSPSSGTDSQSEGCLVIPVLDTGHGRLLVQLFDKVCYQFFIPCLCVNLPSVTCIQYLLHYQYLPTKLGEWIGEICRTSLDFLTLASRTPPSGVHLS